VTTGGAWPCEEGRAPIGSALILSAEDDAADTIRPRLDAAGADVTRVHLISAVRQGDGKGRCTFNLQADLALLEEAIKHIGKNSAAGRRLYLVLDGNADAAIHAVQMLHPLSTVEYTGVRALPETIQKLGLVVAQPKQL
jgi:hypothetical protein